MDWLCNNSENCELCEGYTVDNKECTLDRVKGTLMKAAQKVNKSKKRIEVTVDTETAEAALMLLDTLQASYCTKADACPFCDVHITNDYDMTVCPFDTVRQKFVKGYFGV